MDNILGIIIAFGGGLFSITASILNWDLFFDSKKASLMIKILGRNGARTFYGLLGVFLLFMGYKLLMK